MSVINLKAQINGNAFDCIVLITYSYGMFPMWDLIIFSLICVYSTINIPLTYELITTSTILSLERKFFSEVFMHNHGKQCIRIPWQSQHVYYFIYDKIVLQFDL